MVRLIFVKENVFHRRIRDGQDWFLSSIAMLPIISGFALGPILSGCADTLSLMDGRYNVGTDHIRMLTISCHALDAEFDRLFNSETICGQSKRIEDAYERLLSANLINLAVSIRVSALRNEAQYAATGFVEACGLFDDNDSFSIKDVCDKIIHADTIQKLPEPGVKGACFELKGTHWKKPWNFGLGVTIFCEYILLWLDQIEDREVKRKKAGKGRSSTP